MSTSTITRTDGSKLQEPIVPSTRGVTQAFSVARRNPLALDVAVAASSIDNLNQLLADTMTLRDLYKKHHWQASGPNFYSIHLLFDKHFGEQAGLVDLLAEGVQTLGGVSIAMATRCQRNHPHSACPRAVKTPKHKSNACFRLMKPSSWKPGRWPAIPRRVVIWERMT